MPYKYTCTYARKCLYNKEQIIVSLQHKRVFLFFFNLYLQCQLQVIKYRISLRYQVCLSFYITENCRLYTLEKTERLIKNEQSSNTDNVGLTIHGTKTNKTKHSIANTTRMKRDADITKPWVNPGELTSPNSGWIQVRWHHQALGESRWADITKPWVNPGELTSPNLGWIHVRWHHQTLGESSWADITKPGLNLGELTSPNPGWIHVSWHYQTMG